MKVLIAFVAMTVAQSISAASLLCELPDHGNDREHREATNENSSAQKEDIGESESFFNSKEFYEAVLSISTLVLALATVGLAAFTYRAIRRADRNSMIELRAYIHSKSHSMEILFPHYAPYVFVRFQNTGKTPALNVQSSMQISLVNWPFTGDLPFPPRLNDASKSVLAPGATQTTMAEMDEELSQDDYDAVMDRRKAVVVSGRIEYDDVFGRHCWTSYRLRADGTTIIDLKKNERARLIHTNDGNAFDMNV